MKKMIAGIRSFINRASSRRYSRNLNAEMKRFERQTSREQKALAFMEKHFPNSRLTKDLRLDIKLMAGSMPADMLMYR